MANNTFIKLFNNNPSEASQRRREEIQSVQYAEQIVDDSSVEEEGKFIVQKLGSNRVINFKDHNTKSHGVGLADHHVQDS